MFAVLLFVIEYNMAAVRFLSQTEPVEVFL